MRNKYVWIVCIFFIIIGINFLRGIIANHSRMILISDIKGFLNYLILIPMLCVFVNRERVMQFLKLFVHTATIVAIVAVVLSFFLRLPENIRTEIYNFFNGYGICGISALNSNVVRVFFHTAGRWFFVAAMFAFGFSIIEDKRKTLWLIEMSFMMAATFISFTRSIYFGVAIGIIVLVILVILYYKTFFKDMLKNAIIMVVVTLLLIGGMSVIAGGNMFQIALQRTLLVAGDQVDNESNEPEDVLTNDDAEEQNLAIRGSRKEIVWNNIKKNPIFGQGLGVVNDANGEHIEYFYLDIWSKIGFVGVLLFLMPYIIHVWDIRTKKDIYCKEQKIMNLVGNSGLLCLLVISYFNPCMNTAVGLAIYALVIAMSIPWKNNQTDIR